MVNPGDLTPTVPSVQAPSSRAEGDSAVTPQAEAEQRVIGREERVVYRDQDGNLLNDEQVAALQAEGKVTFKTKYETRTRLVDADGNEIPDSDGVAPEHPDYEGMNPDTKGLPDDERRSQPADAEMSNAGSGNREGDSKPRPASDASEATK